MHLEPVILVLIQIVVVIGFSRLMGAACRQIQQPLVIGEIIAGILLGPSLLGLILPDFKAWLFPIETLPYLDILSQIGLIFFMFLIGLELNPKYLSGQLKTAILTSHVSIIVPFSLGNILALFLYPLVSTANVSFTAFALFLGAAMSITAFPVLARIITENNLQATKLGTLALTCAAVDDVTAWCLLALAIAVARTGTIAGAFPTIVLSIVYIALMVTLGRKVLQILLVHYKRTGRLSQLTLAGIYMAIVISALITELIGIHFIFGAFLLGAVMPKNAGLVKELAEKTEDFVLIFLLPIFFAYSGLRTEVGLLNRPELWLLCGAIFAVAVTGKFVGTYVAARASGINNQEASALGWLMNTRGLTELIVLNIGLSLGVITPLLFTMLVIMALATTFMTSPLLEWTYPKDKIRLDIVEQETPELETESTVPIYRVLVPVANPLTQRGLLKLAIAIAGKGPAVVHPLSLIEFQEDYQFQSTPDQINRLIKQRRDALETLITTLDLPEGSPNIHPIVTTAQDVARETVQIAIADKADLIIVGWHRSAFVDNRLGGRVGKILNNSPADVAVFVNKQKAQLQSLLVAYADNIHDDLGFSLALRMLFNDRDRTLQILRFNRPNASHDGHEESTFEFRRMLEVLPESVRSRINIIQLEDAEPIEAVVEASRNVDLTIAGTSRTWGIERQTLGRYTDELAQNCHSSLLITRRYSRVISHLASLIPETSVR
jgi:Kef-type K+ transport system membrane component KefB/nucleotide-binding universal stress UspA family protein